MFSNHPLDSGMLTIESTDDAFPIPEGIFLPSKDERAYTYQYKLQVS